MTVNNRSGVHSMNNLEEFERQTQNLIEKQYPQEANISINEFLNILTPLKTILEGTSLSELDIEKGILPFVIVVKSDIVSTEKAMQLVNREGKTGNTKLFPLEPKDFKPISDIIIPEKMIYLLINIDRGKETINIRPEDALTTIHKQNRSPLTIDEGIAIITQYPEFLIKNNCFSLLASRHTGDQRVPAIWINSEKRPHLGWCWDRNPHTWLGSASCKARM
jgi:hypothetical protein